MAKRVLLAAILFLWAAQSSEVASSENVPKPVGWVNDFAGVISAEYRKKMTDVIEELEAKTSAEIMVATIGSIAPYDEKSYARLLFDNWKPGKRGKDNGVLILLAVKEWRWRIETGYGVEGILPDGLCGDIGRNYMVPYFKTGRYGEGLYYGAARIASVIAKDAKIKLQTLSGAMPIETASGPLSDLSLLYITLIILMFIIIPFVMSLAEKGSSGYESGTGLGGGGGFGGGGFGGGGGGGGGGGAGGGF